MSVAVEGTGMNVPPRSPWRRGGTAASASESQGHQGIYEVAVDDVCTALYGHSGP